MKQKFPPGWDEKRVKELIAHYEVKPRMKSLLTSRRCGKPRTSR